MKEEIRLMSHFYYCIVVLIFLKKIQIIRFALNLTSLIGLWKNMWDIYMGSWSNSMIESWEARRIR
jgi:hypothetical protein